MKEDLPRGRSQTDFKEIKGQEHVKRALEVAAAGNHNVLMNGPPGAGKTLLVLSLPGIMPRMSIEEALDVTRIYSILDQLPSERTTDPSSAVSSKQYSNSSARFAALLPGGLNHLERRKKRF